jgi:hypothetical protein
MKSGRAPHYAIRNSRWGTRGVALLNDAAYYRASPVRHRLMDDTFVTEPAESSSETDAIFQVITGLLV